MKNIRALIVQQIRQEMQSTKAGVLINYQGLSAEDVNSLRRSLEEKNLKMRVYKNTLLRIALRELELGTDESSISSEELFSQPTAVIFAPEGSDPVDAAKAITDWKKEAEKKNLPIKGGFYEEKLLSSQEVEQYAKLPSREVLLAQVVGAIAAPLRSFLSVLQAPMRDLVMVLKSVQEKKEQE